MSIARYLVEIVGQPLSKLMTTPDLHSPATVSATDPSEKGLANRSGEALMV